jgi:hypothetical protein
MQRSPGTLLPQVRKRCADEGSANAGFDLFDDSRDENKRLNVNVVDAIDFIVDIREWDVPYHVRVLIDKGKETLDFLLLLLTDFRYQSWKVVLGRGKAWENDNPMLRRQTATC